MSAESTSGYEGSDARMNQFVPQLMLGPALSGLPYGTLTPALPALADGPAGQEAEQRTGHDERNADVLVVGQQRQPHRQRHRLRWMRR